MGYERNRGFTHASCLMPHARLHLHSLNKVRRFFAGFESHIGLAPVAALSFELAHALHFSADVEQTNLFDFNVEELLHRVLDLNLVCLRIDLERNDVRLVDGHVGNDDEVPLLDALRKRALEGCFLFLRVHLVAVVARLRTEDRAAVTMNRRTIAALTRPARALLPERLLARAAHFGARL